MTRIFIAVLLGLCGFFAYVGIAVVLADRVQPLNWTVQVLYFLVAGVLWVLPAHFLMLWAARK